MECIVTIIKVDAFRVMIMTIIFLLNSVSHCSLEHQHDVPNVYLMSQGTLRLRHILISKIKLSYIIDQEFKSIEIMSQGFILISNKVFLLQLRLFSRLSLSSYVPSYATIIILSFSLDKVNFLIILYT